MANDAASGITISYKKIIESISDGSQDKFIPDSTFDTFDIASDLSIKEGERGAF
jgi:hypothetical protein